MMSLGSLQRKSEVHGQRTEQHLHHLFGDRAYIQALDKADRPLALVLRNVIRAQRHGVEQADLLLQRQIFVAGMRHIGAHDAGRANLHFVKVALRQPGLASAEDSMQFLCRLLKNVLGGLPLGVGFDVDFPQILVHLRQRQLNGRLNRIDIDGRQFCSRHAARHGELIGKHEFHQLRQHAVLGSKDVLKGAAGNPRSVDNLRQRGSAIPFFQKQLHADGQYTIFREQTRVRQCNGNHPLNLVYTPIL